MARLGPIRVRISQVRRRFSLSTSSPVSLNVIPGLDPGINRGTVLVQIPGSSPGMMGKADVFFAERLS